MQSPTSSPAVPEAGSRRLPAEWPKQSKFKPNAAEDKVLEEKLGEAEMAIKVSLAGLAAATSKWI